MLPFLEASLTNGSLILLLLALAVAFGFEFINGFHDTSNAVATVIYTRALQPWAAVVLSGICNFLGVFLGGVGVALSITHLLPTELLVSEKSSLVLALVMALLVAATMWNLGTWYLGIPCSSSHTLIGSILGAGLGYSLLPGHVFGVGINWAKAGEVLLSLLISPIIGFVFSYLLLKAAKLVIRDKRLHKPAGGKAPPFWIRCLLVGTCGGVSLAHGSNDGQKGIGLVMIILIGFIPAGFALNLNHQGKALPRARHALVEMQDVLEKFETRNEAGSPSEARLETLKSQATRLDKILEDKNRVGEIASSQRLQVRQQILFMDETVRDLSLEKSDFPKVSNKDWQTLAHDVSELRLLTDYAPSWVLMMTALALGVGTMIGWKRIVVTVGEKIGQSGLTCAQGASAQLVAMSTIGLSSVFGLPVSTTHVLSSGISGAMVAQPAGLQLPTVKKIASAWILTLPVSMILSAGLFLLFWLVFC